MDSGQLAGSEAIDELRQFLRLRPDQVDAQVRLADLLFAKEILRKPKCITSGPPPGPESGARL
jgi:hypothetical protein